MACYRLPLSTVHVWRVEEACYQSNSFWVNTQKWWWHIRCWDKLVNVWVAMERFLQVHHKEVQLCTEDIWSCHWLHSHPSASMNIVRQADCRLVFGTWTCHELMHTFNGDLIFFFPPINVGSESGNRVPCSCVFGSIDLRRDLCICRHSST